MEMCLYLEPSKDIHFSGPYDKPAISFIRITNVSKQKQVFKIKTTAPKEYCVRPTFGTISPKETKVICLRLQPNSNITPDTKHRFMIVSLRCPTGDYADFSELWAKAEAGDKPQSYKLRSEFSAAHLPVLVPPIASITSVGKITPKSDDTAAQRALPISPNTESKTSNTSIPKTSPSSVSPRKLQEPDKKEPSIPERTVLDLLNKKPEQRPEPAKVEKPSKRIPEQLPADAIRDQGRFQKPNKESDKGVRILAEKMEKYKQTPTSSKMPDGKMEFMPLERRVPTHQLIIGLTCLLVGIFLGKYVL